MPLVGREVGEIVDSIKADEIKFVPTVEKIWDVQNFNELAKGQVVRSPIFDGDSKGVNKWRLEVKLKQDEKIPDVDVEVGLTLIESESPQPVKTEFQLSFLNSANKILCTEYAEVEELLINGFSFFTFEYKIIQSKYLSNDNTLKIHCEVSTPTTWNLKRKQEDEEEYSVKKQFKSFFTNGDFADMILKTESTSFPASKMILAAHSPVFSAMFSSGMLESTENIVKIEDFSDEAVKAFLEFMYTGETPILQKNPADLLKIADKYQVMELKKKAESVLLRKLKVKRAVEILILAHFHSPTILKPKVITFVNRNVKQIQQTPEFNEMAKKYPDLVLDLYRDLALAEKQDDS